jgi:hypothetical protein
MTGLSVPALGRGATRIWDNGVPALLAYDILFGIQAHGEQ